MKVAIAVDGSRSSFEAMKLLSRLPFSFEEVHVLSVASIVEVNSPYSLTAKEIAFNAQVTRAANTLLLELKDHWDLCGREVAKTHLIAGNPAEKILNFLASESIDLLALGARGTNESGLFNLGAIASAVANHSFCSILLHRGQSDTSWSPTKPLDLLLPFDISDATKYVVDVLAACDKEKIVSADFVHYILHKLCYGIDCSDSTKEDWPDKKKAIEKAAVAAQKLLSGPNLATRFHMTLGVEDIASAISRDAVTRAKDIIVMGTNNRSWYHRLALGSVSSRLMHHSERPILVLKNSKHAKPS